MFGCHTSGVTENIRAPLQNQILSRSRILTQSASLRPWSPTVQHQLTPKNMMDRISICEALAKRNEIDPFLKRMVTEGEKWVTYDNIVRKRSWSKRGEAAQTVAKPGLTVMKVLLCIWWDWKGIIYYDLLQYGQTLNSNIYCQKLDRLKLAIDQKQPELANRRGVAFHQDNARPHTSVVTRQKL
ncbi:histone-lysine N-methyltransferase SETMAR [Trichonephila clavipes]|nr:histone-lysine N-methyltransferase SETMAR [Trichonephila clavipes]